MIIPATWKLPECHTSVSVWATREEAEQWARDNIDGARSICLAYYLTDKRGAWEVIAYPVGDSNVGNAPL